MLSTYAEQGTVRLRLRTTQSTATRKYSLKLPGVERRKCAASSIDHTETKRGHWVTFCKARPRMKEAADETTTVVVAGGLRKGKRTSHRWTSVSELCFAYRLLFV